MYTSGDPMFTVWINTEEKAKAVAAVCGTAIIKFLARLAFLH